MDSLAKIFMQRAINELITSKVLFELSNNKLEKENFQIDEEVTFYSSVISHAYYSIFYASKSILLTKNIKTTSPEVHKRTYESFKEQFIDTGVIDMELLKIYKKMAIRADELLEIFKDEKWKRGHYTYHTIPQANREPAKQSIQNATKFLQNIKTILEK